MKQNGQSTFYLIYGPTTCEYMMERNPEFPFYMAWGYYISGCPFEHEKIVYKGSYDECKTRVISLCHFTMN